MSHPEHLTFFGDDNPGYTRKKWGKGFRYLDADLKPIKQKNEIKRIKKLVIPPAWQQVWISPLSHSHLQCTGKDLKRRKQYLYHPEWMAYRQHQKFSKLKEFGYVLPKIRKTYSKALEGRKWTKHKVVSLIVCLLDKHYFRIGNQQYTDRNDTYGLTTLRRKHIQSDANTLALVYKAKSGKLRNIRVEDKKITKLLREVSELPGYEIFRYRDESGSLNNIDSSDVNEYLKNLTGEAFTAKDFRTWGASKLVLEEYQPTLNQLLENNRLNFEPTLVKRVAKLMGNTVSVCRQYYIHPEVLAFLTDHEPKAFDKLFNKKDLMIRRDMSIYENALLSILR